MDAPPKRTNKQAVYPNKLRINGLVPMRSWHMLLAFTTYICFGEAQELEFFESYC
jgi:hypothetical protein